MFDFDGLPPFESHGSILRRAGYNEDALETSFVLAWVLLFATLWVATNEYTAAYTAIGTALFVADVAYLGRAAIRVGSFLNAHRVDNALFTTTRGRKLLERGDAVTRGLDHLRRRCEWHARKRPGPHAPDSFAAFVETRLRRDWYALRRAAWQLHQDQQNFCGSPHNEEAP